MLTNLNRIAEKNAAKQVAEALTIPQQLSTVAQLKSDAKKKKQSLEVQLRTMVQTQMEEAKEGYALLDESTKLVSTIRSNFTQVDELCKECSSLIQPEEYRIIKEINIARENFYSTLIEIGRFLKVPDTVQKINSLLVENDIYILQVHKEVRNLEKERDEAYEKSKEKKEELSVLEFALKDVETLSKHFEAKLFDLGGRCLELAQVRFF